MSDKVKKPRAVRKGKVNARTVAKVDLGMKSRERMLSRDIQTKAKLLMEDSIVPKKRMKELAEQVGARLKRVEFTMVDSPPPSKTLELPVRKGKDARGEIKLNTKLAREICKHLERGAQLVLVCSWVGITPATLGVWLKMEGEPYATFQDAVRKSLAFAEMKMMVMIEMGCYNDPNAAMKWMAMRYPNKYQEAPKTQVIVSGNLDLGTFLAQRYEARRSEFEQRRAKVLGTGTVIEGEVVEKAPEVDTEKKV